MQRSGHDKMFSRRPRAVSGAERVAVSAVRRYVAFLTVCFWLSSAFGAALHAAESGGRPMPREFDPFDVLAWEILAGIDASGDALRQSGAREDERVRIAIRPFSIGQTPLPASLANAYNDKLLVSLLSQGGSEYRFIAREALGAVIEEMDESSAREAELDDLLSALVERAKADVLVVGKLRRTSDDAVVLSYEAVAVRDGTILAATSFQRLALDPAEVDLAVQSEARQKDARPAARPTSDDHLEFPIDAVEAPLAEHSAAKRRPARPNHEVALLQADLRDLGYDPGPVDGVLGVRTRAAIRAYQRDAGLPVDGQVSARLVEHLRSERAAHESHAATSVPAGAAPIRPDPVADRRARPDPYNPGGTYCREFQQTVRIGGAAQASYGRACLQADGSWKIVK